MSAAPATAPTSRGTATAVYALDNRVQRSWSGALTVFALLAALVVVTLLIILRKL